MPAKPVHAAYVVRRMMAGQVCMGSKMNDELARLEHDPEIGPDAPGNGDLVTWCYELAHLVITRTMHMSERDLRMLANLSLLGEEPDYLEKDLVHEFFARAWNEVHDAFKTTEHEAAWPTLVACMEDFAIEVWGELRFRIPVRRKVRDLDGKLARAIQEKTPLKLIPERVGISRATMYRRLKQPNAKD